MNRPSLLLILSGFCCVAGCATSLFSSTKLEQRVIDQFTEAVSEDNEPALRRIASSRFEEKAMKSDDVLSDLRVLHLPTGKLSVVEVKEQDNGGREVIVKEETGGKYQFYLVRDEQKGYWTVDDILVRQKNKGTRATKSTTEVMDLLMTLRQFLGVWESGERDEILAMTSPALTESLEQLPDEWLSSLAQRIASAYEEGMARKPEANLNEDDAVVKLPAKNGHLMIKLVRGDNTWLVDDVEAHNHREENHPGSVRRQADAINSVNTFLTAYRTEDHGQLQTMTAAKFYDGSLKLADLSMIELPGPADVPDEFDVRAYEDQLTFMIPKGNEIVRIDLQERDPEAEIPNPTEMTTAVAAAHKTRFLVKDVTLYERGTQRQRSLSSAFTAPARAALFLKAMRDRDHQMLSQTAADEFSRSTWKRVTPEILAILPIPPFYDEDLKLTDSHSVGQRTEMEFRTGSGMIVSCRMLNENGYLRMEDVQYPNDKGQVSSLRSQLELAVPILEFATAWQSGDMSQLQKASSADFNRLVWTHLTGIPQQFPALATQLMEPVKDTRVTQERATVILGSDQTNSITASLVMEQGFWVIDELRTFEDSGLQVGVREKLRGQIAARLLSGSYSTVQSGNGHEVVMPLQNNAAPQQTATQKPTKRTASGIVPASAETSKELNRGMIQHAIHQQVEGEPDSAPMMHAVFTQEHPAPVSQQMAASTAPAMKPANATQASTARSATGFEVFGPEAHRVAQELDAPPEPVEETAPPASGEQPKVRLHDAIDMTPASTETSSSTSVNDSFMYFGPDRRELMQSTMSAVATASDSTTAPKLSAANGSSPLKSQQNPRKIKNPADHPIAIE